METDGETDHNHNFTIDYYLPNVDVWLPPIMDFRHAYYSRQKVLPTFTIPVINDESN